MSDQAARAALSRMNMREQAVSPQYQGFAADLRQMAMTNPEEAHQAFMESRRHELCEAYGFARSEQRKPFAFSNGVAIIPVSGSLINRFGQSYGYVTGYNFIRAQHNAAILDDEVTMIVHDHNSYGGEAAGCFELSDDIFASRGAKPILAVVDSNCYSASYALASAADKIIVTPSGGVGSIGVVAMHVDMSKMLNDWGITITYIHSGDHKVDGNPYEPLPKEVKADIQKGVDKSRGAFVKLVARNRGLDEKVIHDTEARTYRTEDALALGLIDAIAAPSAALQAFLDESDVSDDSQSQLDNKGSSVTTAEQQAANAASASASATATARTEERARVGGIVGCDEAKGREALANHLAMNTDMSLESAKGVLAAAPTAAVPAAAEPAAAAPAALAAPAAAADANRFKQAMDGGTHPAVGADGGGGGGDGEKEKPHLAILRDQEKATGVKFTEK